MKIVIAGGSSQAEFIISMFKKKKNELVVINPNKDVAALLLKRCRIPVYVGAPWRKYVLEEANAYDADVFIALNDSDTDNYACCLLARDVFTARKCICLVNNPKNVELFSKLGIDSVISSTYLLAQSIKDESDVESLVRTLSLDNDKIKIIEAVVLSKYKIAGKRIMDIGFPKTGSIACIQRDGKIIIPNGQVVLEGKDVLMVMTAATNEKKILAFIQQEKSKEDTLAELKSKLKEKPVEQVEIKHKDRNRASKED